MARSRITKLAAAAAVGIAVAGALAAAAPGMALAATSSIFRMDTSPQTTNSILRASTAISANDVWAVGNTNTTATGIGTLAEHFDGSTWSVVPTPQPSVTFLVPSSGAHFSAVSAVSSTDVWAIGTFGRNQQEAPFT